MSQKLLESSLLDILFRDVSCWEKSAEKATGKKHEPSSHFFPMRMEQFYPETRREIHA